MRYLWVVATLAIGGAITWWASGERRAAYVELQLWALPLVAAGLTLAVAAVVLGQRRARRQAVEQARRSAEAESRRAHRTFVGRLDHELKNPVTALKMALPSVSDPVLARQLMGQVDRLQSLVGELRKLSEIDEYPVAQEPVDLAEVIDDVLAALDLSDRDVVVSLPRAPRPLPAVWGDRDLVFLALYNVVSNAHKYSGPGATIEIRASEERHMVRVEVSDTGCGIPAGEVDQVWGELARGSGVRHIPGHGLGLSMVAAVTRRLGGGCELSSIEGQGTTVVLRLPLGAQ